MKEDVIKIILGVVPKIQQNQTTERSRDISM